MNWNKPWSSDVDCLCEEEPSWPQTISPPGDRTLPLSLNTKLADHSAHIQDPAVKGTAHELYSALVGTIDVMTGLKGICTGSFFAVRESESCSGLLRSPLEGEMSNLSIPK
jgi:hypothetical protein